jgi:hypothetical protein
MMKPHDGGSGNSNGVNLVCEVRYMPHVGINIETIALHTLSHDFTTSTSTSSSNNNNNKDGSASRGGGSGVRRVPRDTISTAQDTALLSSGGSPCAPAAFTDETRLSHRLYEAILPALLLNDSILCGGSGSKTCIEVFVYILQSDGCVFDAAVTGATLALVDANIPMKDVIVASTAAVVLKSSSLSLSNVEEFIAIADPTEEEILLAKGIVTIAIMPNIKEVTVFDQFGKMSIEECTQAIELAQAGCVTMHKFVKNCLLVNTTSS